MPGNAYHLALFALLLAPALVMARPVESWYQKVWCEGVGGEIEHRLPDGRRIDCLTKTHAIEIEFARKWPEAIGQSLAYSMMAQKEAGIVLLLNNKQEILYWERLNSVVQHYNLPIRLWRLGP